MVKKITIGFLIVAVVMLFVFRIKSDSKQTSKPSLKNTSISIRLKWLHQSQFAGLYVAREKNIFKNKGIDISLNERDFTKPSPLDELIKGETDFAITSPEEFLSMRSKGAKIKAVAAYFQDTPAILVSLEKSAIQTPRDFGGKSFGLVTDSPESRFIVKDLLRQYSIPENSVEYKTIGSDQVTSLINGDVDIILLYRTNGYTALNNRGQQYNIIKPEEFGQISYNDILVTTEAMIAKHPDIVKNVVSGSVEGWKYALAHEKEAVEITYKYSNEKYKNRHELASIFYQCGILIQPHGQEIIGTMNSLKWHILYNKLRAHEILTNDMSIDDVFTNKFLPNH